MRFRSKLLQPRTASEPTLTKIHDVDMTPDGRVEGEDQATTNALEGREVTFQFRDRQIPFSAEGFVLSFSLPNFYFHAATAYDILRSRGAPIGKRDFIGELRIKR